MMQITSGITEVMMLRIFIVLPMKSSNVSGIKHQMGYEKVL